jgi:hypothetical protein
MILDKPLSEHTTDLDLLGFHFCKAAYELFYETTATMPQIAHQLLHSIPDVSDGIDAWEVFLALPL